MCLNDLDINDKNKRLNIFNDNKYKL